MDHKYDEFFDELKDIFISIRDLVDRHGLSEEFTMAAAAGLFIEGDEEDEDGNVSYDLTLMTDFHVGSEEELDEVIGQASDVMYKSLREQIESRKEKDDQSGKMTWSDLERTERTFDDWMRFIGDNTEESNNE